MLEMVDQAAVRSEDRKLRIVKTAAEIVAMAIVGAVVLFFALAPYAKG